MMLALVKNASLCELNLFSRTLCYSDPSTKSGVVSFESVLPAILRNSHPQFASYPPSQKEWASSEILKCVYTSNFMMQLNAELSRLYVVKQALAREQGGEETVATVELAVDAIFSETSLLKSKLWLEYSTTFAQPLKELEE